jgi:YhcH/YjgK/YiaL family protein
LEKKMILDHVDQAARYAHLHPLFAKAFDFLRTTDLAALAPGRHELGGDTMYVSVDQKSGRGRKGARLESHQKYIDIQVTVSGSEEIGWRRTANCAKITEAFKPHNDIQFYGDDPVAWIAVPPKHFVIFWPEDAHAPLAGKGELQKVIVKIAVRI